MIVLLSAPAGRAEVAAAAPQKLVERARAQVAAGDATAALEAYEAALAAEPDNLRYGAEYRQAVIAAAAYDRAVAFLEQLTAEHPQAANAHLNLGFAFVDKIPTAGAITQVILANTALTHFSAALELDETWLGRYTRGNSYLYWPAIFGRTPLGIADLERAIALAGEGERRPYHARAYAALGDGYWRLEDLDKAREIWRRGLELFPGDPHLRARLERDDDALDAFLEAHFATDNRVDTTLRELWEEE